MAASPSSPSPCLSLTSALASRSFLRVPRVPMPSTTSSSTSLPIVLQPGRPTGLRDAKPYIRPFSVSQLPTHLTARATCTPHRSIRRSAGRAFLAGAGLARRARLAGAQPVRMACVPVASQLSHETHNHSSSTEGRACQSAFHLRGEAPRDLPPPSPQ